LCPQNGRFLYRQIKIHKVETGKEEKHQATEFEHQGIEVSNALVLARGKEISSIGWNASSTASHQTNPKAYAERAQRG
jgi:hypothetical protein